MRAFKWDGTHVHRGGASLGTLFCCCPCPDVIGTYVSVIVTFSGITPLCFPTPFDSRKAHTNLDGVYSLALVGIQWVGSFPITIDEWLASGTCSGAPDFSEMGSLDITLQCVGDGFELSATVGGVAGTVFHDVISTVSGPYINDNTGTGGSGGAATIATT